MTDKSDVQQIVEQAVGKVLADQLPQLQSQLVQRVLQSLPAPEVPAAGASDATALLQALTHVHAGSTQKEILRTLLDGGSAHCARIALFVVKAGAATGWQGRGFAEDEAVKDFALDISSGPAGHGYQNRVTTPGNIAEMDARFVEQFGAPSNEQVLVLPLVLKDKVAALVYADGGSNGKLEGPALELLVLATGSWLEVVSLRKQAVAKDSMESVERPAAAAPVQTASSFSDPFAGHTPKHIAPVEPEPVAEVVEVAAVAHASAGSAASAPAAAADPFAGLSPEDADTHRKAQRFARLLVDEIKLYNQAKVAEGRKHKDLYDRMKDDIEKSRSTYQKRYGTSVAGAANYFQAELVRSLGEDDISVMGPNFKR